MRRAGRIALWTAGGVLLALLVFVLVFDWNWLERPLAKAVAGATGRTLEVGNISGRWRWHPRVRLEEVRLSNPEWAQAPNLLTADAVGEADDGDAYIGIVARHTGNLVEGRFELRLT